MCDSAVATQIIDVLGQFVIPRKVFTAYDVTKEVRQGTTDPISHNDVRDVVRQELRAGNLIGYNAQLMTLDVGNKPQAMIYYPDSKSPTDYPLAVKDNDTTDDDDDTDDVVDGDGVVCVLTAEKRFNIPKKLTRQIDLAKSGGSYDLVINGSMVCRTPASDGRVRIAATNLGVSGNKITATVDCNTNTIVIEQM